MIQRIWTDAERSGWWGWRKNEFGQQQLTCLDETKESEYWLAKNLEELCECDLAVVGRCEGIDG